MSRTKPDQSRREGGEETQTRLNRKIFQLQTLYETLRELNRLSTPADMADSFLLSGLGGLGLSKGFILLTDSSGKTEFLSQRGLAPEEAARLESGVKDIGVETPSSKSGQDEAAARDGLVMRNMPADSSFLPAQTNLAISWLAHGGRTGILGLGPKISGQPLLESEERFLHSLTALFIQDLDLALSKAAIERLNLNLKKKNLELEKSLASARQARTDLDRRVFHLKALSDISLELGGLEERQSIMDSFLLTLMGVFSLQGGAVVIYDGEQGGVLASSRGETGLSSDLSPQAAKELIFKYIRFTDFEKLLPLNVQFAEPPPEDNPRGDRVVVFRLDQDSLGVLLLGQRLTNGPGLEEEKELAPALCRQFIGFMNKARSIETIRGLNRDLSVRNKELEETIQELTRSRKRIEFLERAFAGVKNRLRAEAEKIDRVSKLDFLWIICAGLILGLIFNFSSPNGVEIIPKVWKNPRTQTISIDEALDLSRKKGAEFVDARPARMHETERIKDSVNMPPSLFDFIYSMKFGQIDLDRMIIVHGRTVSSLYDEEVALKLKSQGHENVRRLDASFDELEKSGFPLEKKPKDRSGTE